ncbi:MAG: uridine monophosphate kinase [Gammaproteobacteria bacterium]|nr:uridine monophosphate kinase [Gammaproteobacteria bacterium]
MTQSPVYQRILLKISGESFASHQSVFCEDTISFYAEQIAAAYQAGTQIGVVTGGGNVLRGAKMTYQNIERTTADQIGMLATVMNTLLLRDLLESKGVKTTLFCSVPLQGIAHFFDPHAARQKIQSSVVLYAGGIANPFFSTDTCAAVRAIETHCQLLIKLTDCGGIYDSDPKKNTHAKMFDNLSFESVLTQRYAVMDLAAFSLCNDHRLPILVTRLSRETTLLDLAFGRKYGTFVQP